MPIDRDPDPRPLALTKRLHKPRGNLQPPHRLWRLDVGSELHGSPSSRFDDTPKTDERHLKGQLLIHARAATPCSGEVIELGFLCRLQGAGARAGLERAGAAATSSSVRLPP